MPRNLLVYDRWTHECRDRQGRRQVCRRGLAPKSMASQSFIDGELGNGPQIMGYGGSDSRQSLGAHSSGSSQSVWTIAFGVIKEVE